VDVFGSGNHIKLSLGIFLGLIVTLAIAYAGLQPLEFARRLKDTEARFDAGMLENALRNYYFDNPDSSLISQLTATPLHPCPLEVTKSDTCYPLFLLRNNDLVQASFFTQSDFQNFYVSNQKDSFLICFKPMSKSYKLLADRDNVGHLTENGEFICVP